jgi:hypothetical protein
MEAGLVDGILPSTRILSIAKLCCSISSWRLSNLQVEIRWQPITLTGRSPISDPFTDRPSVAVGSNNVWVSYTDSG